MVITTPTTNRSTSEDEARKQWFEDRKRSVGSSDAAAVLGVHPYKSAYAVWAEKTGVLQSEPCGDESAEWGQILEPIIAEQYQRRTGRALMDYGRYYLQRNPKYPFAHTTIDREIVAFDTRGPGILEIKNVSLRLNTKYQMDFAQSLS